MNWKEFLKPTKPRIGIAAFFYLFFVPIIETCVYCFTAPCPGCRHVSLINALFFYTPFPSVTSNWLFAIIGIPVSYLVSCTIVGAFNSMARRLKK